MLIYFKSHNCLFARIPKTASTTIVRKIFGTIRQGRDRIYFGEFPEEHADKFSFAFVRNPFERFVSAYSMFKTILLVTALDKPLRDSLTLARCVEVAKDDNINLRQKGFINALRLHLIPMTNSVFHLDRMQFVGRYENLAEDWGKVGKQIKTTKVLPIYGKSNRPHYSTFYDAALRAAVGEFYKADLERFGYSFETA